MKTVKSVKINDLVCDDRLVYVKEGYGGRHIKHFPVVLYLQKWDNGKVADALTGYATYLSGLFLKYQNTPKRVGGMKTGTFNMTYKNLRLRCAGASFYDAAMLIVLQRFALFDSIKRDGFFLDYDKNNKKQVRVKPHGKVFKIAEGHHRVACLYVLGYHKVPGVLIRG